MVLLVKAPRHQGIRDASLNTHLKPFDCLVLPQSDAVKTTNMLTMPCIPVVPFPNLSAGQACGLFRLSWAMHTYRSESKPILHVLGLALVVTPQPSSPQAQGAQVFQLMMGRA